jgi:hypothetical protein
MSNSKDENNNMQNALVEIVQRKDIDPERLEKFLDLQIKMEERQAKGDFQIALSGFQAECPIIRRIKKIDFTSKKTGSQTKYNYSPLDEIVFQIKPILSKWGLAYSFNVEESGQAEIRKLITTIHHKSGHEKEYSYFFNPLHDDNRMNASQRAKSALTYAKRVALENALGIVTAEEDDDANRAIDMTISESQLAEIDNLISNTDTDLKKVLKFAKTDSLEALSFLEAKKVINLLKQKRLQCIG